MNNFIFKKTLIIGLGLIGGSLAKALKKNNLSQEIFAYDEDELAIDLAKNEMIIDDFCNLGEAIKDFDLIAIATPLKSYQEIFKKIFPFLNKNNLVIDLGSIKDFSKLSLKLPINFIACHPLAGSNKSGFEHSESELFNNKKFIICEPEFSASRSSFISRDESSLNLAKIEKMVKAFNGKIEYLSAKKHDQIFSLTSHLPQFLSFLTMEFSPKNTNDIFLNKCFRLDSSSADIWSDIFKFNEKNLENYYQEFFDYLSDNYDNLLNINYNEYFQLASNLNIKTTPLESENIFNENFSAIFFRFLVVANYLKIKDLKNSLQYCGAGFEDFTSLISFSQLPIEKIKFFINKDLDKINKIFHELL